MMLNDLIDRLTAFRNKHGCIPVRFNYGVYMGDGVELINQTIPDDAGAMEPGCILNIWDSQDD